MYAIIKIGGHQYRVEEGKFIDIDRLPYEDGYQALQKVRANPKLKDTIVCAVTAEASEDQMRKAQKSGFDGFLGKPLDPDRFPEQIRRLLAGDPIWEWQ